MFFLSYLNYDTVSFLALEINTALLEAIFRPSLKAKVKGQMLNMTGSRGNGRIMRLKYNYPQALII